MGPSADSLGVSAEGPLRDPVGASPASPPRHHTPGRWGDVDPLGGMLVVGSIVPVLRECEDRPGKEGYTGVTSGGYIAPNEGGDVRSGATP